MIKRICDRCNKEITTNYWTIDIYEKDDGTMRMNMDGAINNLKQNADKVFDREKEYCKECINEIKQVINQKEEKNEKSNNNR